MFPGVSPVMVLTVNVMCGGTPHSGSPRGENEIDYRHIRIDNRDLGAMCTYVFPEILSIY